MNLLIVDTDGVGLDLALRASAYDHNVKLFIRNDQGERNKTGDGLVEKVSDWEKWLHWADLIVPTSNLAYLDRFDELRKYRFPIFGPSKQAAALEINRGFGMKTLEQFGVPVPPYKTFNGLDEAESYVWKKDQKFVFKTMGDDDDKSMSYVPKSPEELVNKIRSWKKKGKKVKTCMLQEFVPGIEMGVSRWMGRDGFLKPYGENFEYKKLMSGDYGKNTGEMGTVMVYSQKSKLSKLTLDPLEQYLNKIGLLGDVDLNCIIDDKGKPWVLEFTCRFGYPAFWIMLNQHQGDPVQWMLDSLNGKDTLKVYEDIFVGLLMTHGNFPNKGGKKEDYQGHPIYGLTEKNWDRIHLVEVMAGRGVDRLQGKMKETDLLVTAGEYVLVAGPSCGD